jgi:hypothetical protein
MWYNLIGSILEFQVNYGDDIMAENKKFTDKEIEENVADVKATLAMENLNLTDYEVEVLTKYGKGIYTQKEVFKLFEI